MSLLSRVGVFAAKTICPSVILLGAVVLSVCQIGCRGTEDEVDVLQGDFTVPQIENFEVTGASTVKIDLSKEGEVSNVVVMQKDGENEEGKDGKEGGEKQSQDKEVEGKPEEQSPQNGGEKTDGEEKADGIEKPDGGIETTVSYTDEGKGVVVSMNQPTEVGEEYVIQGEVEDKNGNSLTFSIPFTGYNENPARLIISEVRNAYGTASIKDENGDSQKVHRSEYVELYVLKGGNLCGLEICSAYDGEKKKYQLPKIYVNAGEFITVHMRTVDAEGFDGEGMESELEDDLTLSTHEDSCDTARDLWSQNTKSCLGDSDIVFIRNIYDGSIVDALVYAKSTVSAWKEAYGDIVDALKKSGVWSGSVEPDGAVCSDLITASAATRSFSRQNVAEAAAAFESGNEIYNGKDVWMITANSGTVKNAIAGITPGFENSSNEYKK